MKIILSIIEWIVGGIFTYKVAIPFFIELAKVIGGWGYFGLVCFLIIVVAEEYASYRENKIAWIFAHILGSRLH